MSSWLPFLLVEIALVAFFVFGYILWKRGKSQKRS
jgi:hypothetical protein